MVLEVLEWVSAVNFKLRIEMRQHLRFIRAIAIGVFDIDRLKYNVRQLFGPTTFFYLMMGSFECLHCCS